MDRDVRWSAGVAAAAVVGLVACLSAAEALDAHWLYIPGVALLLVALLAGEIAVWGLNAFAILIAGLVAVVAVAFAVERIG